MVAKVYTVAFQGIEPLEVEVQVQMASGLPAFQIVGLADKAVAESKERIRASFHNIGLSLPARRITVNLAPADLQKEGSHYDLPIAIGLMIIMKILPREDLLEFNALGELGLDGTLAKVPGVLPAAISALSQGKGIICPKLCGPEAAWAGNQKILAPNDLISLVNHFKGIEILPPPSATISKLNKNPDNTDMQDVKGQDFAKRALEIAAAGGHNLLMVGPPGAGKSMLASRLPSILPDLTPQEALDVTIIHSIAGKLPESGLISNRPFRDPHHSASLPALVGGGSKSKPGEISLAHHGVLFLDELPEFSRQSLEALRQPLETGKVTIARVQNHVTYPARVQLVAAMNPCRCGFFGDIKKQCHKIPKCKQDYQQKISGPLLDRFDLVVPVQALGPRELQQKHFDIYESSKTIASRVKAARDIQKNRHNGALYFLNSTLGGKHLTQSTNLSKEGDEMMLRAAERFGLSGRGYHRILRVARTIADLDQSLNIEKKHISEAIAYRQGVDV
jgi:magnesium chelatase family protein